jgi:actin-related protein
MYEGLAERLKDEITNLAPGGTEIRVIAPADRKYSVW